MERTISILKIVLAGIGGYIATSLGGFDNLLMLLIALSFSDQAFGAAKGFKKKGFSSSIFFWGIVNKAVIFVIIAIMVKVDLAIGKVGFLRNAFIIWFSLCESASIIENTAALGIPWPDGLLSVLVQVRKGFSINISKIVQQIIENYKIEDKKDGELR